MTKKTRLIVLLICVVCFLVVAPYIVLYSLGYRVDFWRMKITATGGIYIKADPLPLEISIDSRAQKTNFLANSLFVQNLLPKSHAILIKKDGYYDYQKNLEVTENQVAKLEHVLLFKKNILFDSLIDETDYFSVSPDGKKIIFSTKTKNGMELSILEIENKLRKTLFELPSPKIIQESRWSDNSQMVLLKTTEKNKVEYLLLDAKKIQESAQEPDLQPLGFLNKNSQQIYFNPQDSQELFFIENKKIYSAKNNNTSIIISNAISYKIYNNNIIWLSSEGFLLRSDISGKLIEKIISKNITIDNKKTYEIYIISLKIFLRINDDLFAIELATKNLEKFKIPITGYKLLASDDRQKLICFNDKKIYIYLFADPKKEITFLYETPRAPSGPSSEKIKSLFWLNNDYLIFNVGNKIMISEIDFRDSVNTIILQKESSEIFLNQKNNKLYVLNNGILLSSEKLTP